MKLAVEKLEAGYQGKTVVKDVSFTVEKGNSSSLIGPSGCGKSTVLKVLAGLLEPMAGTIMVMMRRCRAAAVIFLHAAERSAAGLV